MHSLTGKVAIVTGGARGIGLATSLALAREGAAVLVNDIGTQIDGEGRDLSVAQEAVAAIRAAGGQAEFNGADVTSLQEVESMVAQAIDRFGRLDIMICSAGIGSAAPLWEMTEAQWDNVMAVHVKGHFNCTRSAAAPMREQGSGRIVHMTSHLGIHGHPEGSNYATAKAGIIGFTKSAAQALGPFGVTVNALAPSAATRTADLLPMAAFQQIAEYRGLSLDPSWSADEVRLRLLGDPEAVGNFVAYLSSDAAADVQGEVFAVMGGRISRFAPWSEAAVLEAPAIMTAAEIAERAPQELL